MNIYQFLLWRCLFSSLQNQNKDDEDRDNLSEHRQNLAKFRKRPYQERAVLYSHHFEVLNICFG